VHVLPAMGLPFDGMANLVLGKFLGGRGSRQKSWSRTCSVQCSIEVQWMELKGSSFSPKPLPRVEPKRGIEPLTYALRVRCSTD
jgi:hypothetical protein